MAPATKPTGPLVSRMRRWAPGFAALAIAVVVASVWAVTQANSMDPTAAREARMRAFDQAKNDSPSTSQTINGRTWAAGVFSNDLGETCVEIRSPAGWRAAHCPRRKTTSDPAFVLDETVGHSGEDDWIVGYAAPAVKTVDVVLADCSIRTTTVRDGAFLVVGAPTARKLVARGDKGEAIGSRTLDFVGAQPRC